MKNNKEKTTLKSIFEAIVLITIMMYGVYYFTKDLFTFLFAIANCTSSKDSSTEEEYDDYREVDETVYE